MAENRPDSLEKEKKPSCAFRTGEKIFKAESKHMSCDAALAVNMTSGFQQISYEFERAVAWQLTGLFVA